MVSPTAVAGRSHDDLQLPPDESDAGPRAARITASDGRPGRDGIAQGVKSPLLTCRRLLLGGRHDLLLRVDGGHQRLERLLRSGRSGRAAVGPARLGHPELVKRPLQGRTRLRRADGIQKSGLFVDGRGKAGAVAVGVDIKVRGELGDHLLRLDPEFGGAALDAQRKRVVIIFGHAGGDSQLAAGPVPAADFGEKPAKTQGAQHVLGIIGCGHHVLPRQIGNGRIQSRFPAGEHSVVLSLVAFAGSTY